MVQSLELSLNFGQICHILGMPSSFFNIIERVTKSSPCLCWVLSIVTHTKPTELIPALRTSHMHTSLVLFDWSLTFRAGFCVDLDPIARVTFIIVDSIIPFLQQVTVYWHMGIFRTSKTEGVVAEIAENVNHFSLLLLYNLVAVSSRTPFSLLWNVHKWIDQMHLVLFDLLFFQKSAEKSRRHDHIALYIRADRKYNFRTHREFCFQGIPVTLLTKTVSTHIQMDHFIPFIVTEADWTQVLFIFLWL